MTRLRQFIRAQRADERGGTLIFVAVAMSVLLPVTLAFSVEIGEDTVVNRSLQTAADAGALDGARYLDVVPDTVATIAGQAVQRNYSGVAYTVQQGSWSSAGGFVASLTCEATGTCTAVKVTTSASVKHLFESGGSSLSKSSIATVSGLAGFSIGTYLASISTSQSSALKGVLGALGTQVTLTAVGYEGLAETNVTVQQLIAASGGVLTPTNVLTTSLSPAQWNSFLLNAVTTQAAGLVCGGTPTPFPCTAKASLTTLGGGATGSTSASLCQLVSINGSTCSGGNLSQSALSASLNVLQTLTTEAELANNTNGLANNTAVNIAGISATLSTTLIQVPQVAYGPVGTTASTSQVNVSVNTSVAGLGLVSIPITGADGTATLAAISCTNNTMSSTTIDASTTAVSANVTLLGISGVTLSVNAVPSTPLTYTVVPPTTASATAATNPQTVGSTTPTFTVGGLAGLGGLTGLLLSPVLNSLAGSGGLGQVLQALGVNVGGAQVADLSTNCSASSLVG